MAVLTETRPPVDGIRHEEPNTSLFIGRNNVGQGTLYITESYVAWLSREEKGLTLPYPNIILHAVSRDLQKFPQECIYVHTDAEINGLPNEESDENDDGGINDECPPFHELYLVPEDKESLSIMFRAMAECQTLHPDPQDEISADEDFFEEEDEDLDGAPYQLANMQLSNNGERAHNGRNGHGMDMDPECFEDAEDFPDHPDQ